MHPPPVPTPHKPNPKVFTLLGWFGGRRAWALGPLIDGAEEGHGGSVLTIFFSLRVNCGPSAPATRQILYTKSMIVFKKSKCKVINVWSGKSDTFWNHFFVVPKKYSKASNYCFDLDVFI